MRFKNDKRVRTALLGSVALSGVLVSISLSGPAFATQQAPDDLDISTASQAGYEQELSEFLSTTPEPSAVDANAPVSVQNAYQEAMAEWWQEVPWDAVAGQWGCALISDDVVVSEAGADGSVTAGHGGMMQCGDLTEAELSAVSQPVSRSTTEASRGVLATYCDFPGGTEDYCLSNSGSTMTASFQWQGAGNKTGQARLGNVGLSGSCGLGSQVALGAVGIGGQGAVWYASGTVNQNSKWSSSFLISGANYGSWCATI